MLFSRPFVLGVVFALMVPAVLANDCILEKPIQQDLVQDYANVLDNNTEQHLRRRLIAFDDSTSTQIAVVTVTSLCGNDKAAFAHELAEKMGIGQAGKNNGVLVLVKPKEVDGKGEVRIEVGYGLEGVLPDAIAKRIVEQEMIPYFKQKRYDWGINAAVNTITAITSGEFKADDYGKTAKVPFKAIVFFLFFVIMVVSIMVSKVRQARQYSLGHDVSFWTAWMLLNTMNQSRRSRGFWDDFSGGGGSFSGGGFGGFGGGSFGGGGAGGSW